MYPAVVTGSGDCRRGLAAQASSFCVKHRRSTPFRRLLSILFSVQRNTDLFEDPAEHHMAIRHGLARFTRP